MNQNGNTSASAKRNKNRSGGVGGAGSQMQSANVPRSMNRNNNRNSYPNVSQRNYMAKPMANSSNIHYPTTNMNNNNMNNNNMNINNNDNGNGNSNAEAKGIYKNKRLFHSMTSLIGCLIEVTLEDGKRYEGVLQTFSPDFELALSTAALIVEDGAEKRSSGNIGNLWATLENKEEVMEILVIDPKKMVDFKAPNVDLEFATKKTVLTDGEIAKSDGSKHRDRDLIPWEGDDMDGDQGCMEALETGPSTGMSNGWNPEDMLKYNENHYKIESTYTEEMSEYTIKLEHRNDDEYRQREQQAARIAKEIEQDSSRVARYAKENDLDEETLFSAVIRDSETGPQSLPVSASSSASNNNNSNSYHNYRNNEMNSHIRDNDRRDNVRNNSDNTFRAPSARPNRNNRNNRGGGERSMGGGDRPMGPNEPNWRDSNRMNRFHSQSSSSSVAYNQKSQSGSGGGGGGNYGGGGGPKYSNQQQQQQSNQSYSSTASQGKSSYSSVMSHKSVPPSNESNDPDSIKTYPNRNNVSGHPSKDYPPPNNDMDSYMRKPGPAGFVHSPRGEPFKHQQQQQQQQPRTSYSKILEQQHDSKSNKSHQQPQIESETSKNSHPTSPSTPTAEPLTKTNKSEAVSASKSIKSEEGMTSPKSATTDIKKSDSMGETKKFSSNKSPPVPSKDSTASQTDSEPKKVDPPPTTISLSTPSSPPSTSLTNTSTAVMNSSSPSSTTSTIVQTQQQQSTPQPQTSTSTVTSTQASAPSSASPSAPAPLTSEIEIKSKLNPNAKVFTPRGNPAPVAPQPQHQPATVMPSSYHYPMPTGHLSTTPPSIVSTPSIGPASAQPFITYPHPHGASHIPTHPTHHQQQQIRYINPSNISFHQSNFPIMGMPTQYITALPPVTHYTTSMPAGVAAPAPTVPSQAAPPNGGQQPGVPPPGTTQMTSHHMINTSVANQAGSQNNGAPQPGPQGQPPQSQQPPPPSRGHYRNSGSKGPANPNPNQQAQPIMRQHHDFSQQTNVANVTGQPIMAGPAPHGPQHLPMVFPTSTAVHHHNQNPMHAQQSIPQLASQPGHNQPIPYYQFPRPLLQSHPNALNILQSSAIYSDGSHMQMYCTEMPPQMISAQSITPMTQGNMPPTAVANNGAGPTGPPPQASNSPTTQGSVPNTSTQQQPF